MNVFVAGGTGLIGTALIEQLLQSAYKVTILTRNIQKAQFIFGNRVSYCTSLDSLLNFDGYDAVVNLAGESIGGKRWSEVQKDRLCESRWQITQKIALLIKLSINPPSVFISGSAVGYYGSQGNNELIEDSKPNPEFTSYLCQKWEDYALSVQSHKTRVCISRTGIVLSNKGGMLPKILTPFKLGLGSIMGTGNQYISWIHIDDMVGVLKMFIDSEAYSGIYNVVAPNAVTNKTFSKALAKSIYRPCFLKVPSCIIRLILGEQSTLLLNGQRVIPQKLNDAGYKFKFNTINEAFKQILS